MKKLIFLAATMIFVACGGTQNAGDASASAEGLKGKVHKVQTLIYNAKSEGAEVVKDGKPDPYREVEAFPKEDTRIYNQNGQLDSVISVLDATKYITVYAYRDGKVSNEKLFQNGELFTDRQFVYQDGNLVNTIEDMYVGGEKSTNEYPVDASKVKTENGNRVEYGETDRDYVIKDAQGRILKESSYNEMDEYLTVKEYTYNESGWLATCIMGDEFRFVYDYPEIDGQGNWTRMLIRNNDQPYGIVERTITYYE